MQFACMKMNGYYPAPVSESDLFLTPVAEGAGRMRGTLALTSSHHPLEARQIVGELGVTEVIGRFERGGSCDARAESGAWR